MTFKEWWKKLEGWKKGGHLAYLNQIVSSIDSRSRIARVMFYLLMVIILTLVFVMRHIYLELKTQALVNLRILTSLLFKTCPFFNEGRGESCGWFVFSLDILIVLLLFIIIFIFIVNIKISNKPHILIIYGFLGYALGLLRILITLNTISEYEFGFTKNVLIIIFIFPFGYSLLAIILGIIIKIFRSKDYTKITIFIILFLILASYVFPYKVEPTMTVHQHITKEANKVWKLIPFEVKNHTNSNINIQLDNNGYQVGEDTIVGSGEEDTDISRGLFPFKNHFWNPDTPQNGNYNDGLDVFNFNVDSAYTKAKTLWISEVIPNYLTGDINESYYWLGRVVHLIEDSAQPSHVLLDCHMDREVGQFICDGSDGDNGSDDSVLEEYTGNNFQTLRTTYNWSGNNFQGKQYNYENLSNMQNFNWKEVEPTRPLDRQNIELFRLFWYTSQKTQYYASDDANGNSVYVNLSGNQKTFSPSLWNGENVVIISNSADLADDDFNDEGEDIDAEADAMIPHAMKSVAGLYRLFWDAVHIDWPEFHHDMQRTGYTLLKGDLTAGNHKQHWTMNSQSTDYWDKAVIAEIDGLLDDDGQELIVSGTNFARNTGRIFALDGKTTTELWSYSDGNTLTTTAHPTVADVDGDGKKEVVVGSLNGNLYILNITESSATLRCKFQANTYGGVKGMFLHQTVVDINGDGSIEILTNSFRTNASWPAYIFAIDKNCNQKWNTTIDSFGGFHIGSQRPFAIADIDNDGKLEFAMTEWFGIHFYEDNGSEISSIEFFLNVAAPVIADVNNDGNYEIIQSTFNFTPPSCPVNGIFECDNALRVYDNDMDASPLWSKSVDYPIMATPAVANIDDDAYLEVIVATAKNPDFANSADSAPSAGTIFVFDGKLGDQQWNYSVPDKVQSDPVVADIDNDGNKEIIFGSYDGKLYVLSNTGSLEWTENFNSDIWETPAIGDLDGDGMAEIALKHRQGGNTTCYGGGLFFFNVSENATSCNQSEYQQQGEEITKWVLMSGNNTKPTLNNISNISANEGDIIDLNSSGQITATDADNNILIYYYSAPFNSSGQWKTDCSSSGNFSILVEVSDGNLSDWQIVYAQLNDTCGQPIIALISPLNNSINTTTNNPGFLFNVSVNSSCNLMLKNVTWESYGTNTSIIANTTTTIFPNKTLADLSYLWKIECDSYGGNNNESETRTLTIDEYNLTVNIKTINDSYIIGDVINITDPPDGEKIFIGKGSKVWTFTVVEQDELSATINQINNTHFEIIPIVNDQFLDIIKTYLPGYRWKLQTIINSQNNIIAENQKRTDLKKPQIFSIPEHIYHFQISLGESSTLINATGNNQGTRYSPAENVCVDSNGMLHAAWIGSGTVSDVYYGNSSNNGVTWDTKQLTDGIAGSRDHAGIVCGQNEFLMIYYYNGSYQEIVGMNSTDGGKTWTGRFEIESDVSIEDNPSCALDSSDIVHCCFVDGNQRLYYTNSTIYGSSIIVNNNLDDGQILCDIEVDSNDCVYIIGDGPDQDDIDLWSPCYKGWNDTNRSQVYNGAIFTDENNGLSLAIDNDDRIHISVLETSGGDLVYCNGTTSNLTIWNCSIIDSSLSYNPDIAVNANGHIFIIYSDSTDPTSGSEVYYANSSDGSRGINWNVRTLLNLTSNYPSIADTNYPKSNRMKGVLHYLFTNVDKDIYYDNFSIPFTEEGTPFEDQSRIKNEQSDQDEITFTMKVQFFNATLASWVDVNTTYENSTIKTISGGMTLKLDQYWQSWNSSKGNKGTGTYRAWIQVYDTTNNSIINNDGNIFDSYNFSLS